MPQSRSWVVRAGMAVVFSSAEMIFSCVRPIHLLTGSVNSRRVWNSHELTSTSSADDAVQDLKSRRTVEPR